MRNRILQMFLTLIVAAGICAIAPPPEMQIYHRSRVTEPCSADPQVEDLLALSSAEDWSGWIARLSGRDPVQLDGTATFIQTRFSYAMFRGETNARAYEYVLTRLKSWYPPQQIGEDSYFPAPRTEWKNIILTLPGTGRAGEVIILSAHLDSNSDDAENKAPGAEDNATGSAALLEAARIFRTHRFERTVRLIWFTGEEQGLLGSKAYVQDHDLSGVVGVINLDMYGYDPNRDGCFELHIGTLPVSAPIGSCFLTAAKNYSPTLKVDAIDAYDMRFSDHNSFWSKGIGAVEVLENFSSGPLTDVCGGYSEHSPYYHKTTDTLDRINLETGFAITRASLAAAAGLAGPASACFSAAPNLSLTTFFTKPKLAWTAVPGAAVYRIYRADAANAGQAPLCSADWVALHETGDLNWIDMSAFSGNSYAYRVEAVAPGGGCVSAPSACTTPMISSQSFFIPWIIH